MSTVAADARHTIIEQRAALSPRRVVGDIALVAGRNLRKVQRSPGLIVFSTIQPLMQLVLFVFIFGSIASIGGGIAYRDFVVPAVLVQSIAFAAMGSGVGIAYDLQSGMIDRFRSLPIARSAFLVGRTVSDSLRLGLQSLLLVAASLVIGFRFHNGLAGAVGMIVVVVLFGIALTTFSAFVGLAVKDPETVQPAVFIPVLPLVFTSSAFAPVSKLPGWMQPIAKINPITYAIDTARGLALGPGVLYKVSGIHLSTAFAIFAVYWVLIVGVFTALAVHRYRVG